MIRGVRATDNGGCDTPEGYRNKPRRRGVALSDAIYQATLDELTAVGYAELTMDRVATRAKASKGSLYRRWPSRAELVVDAIRHAMPKFGEPSDTGALRTDLLAVMRLIADSLCGPSGEAGRGLIAEFVRNRELSQVVRTHLIDPVEPPMFEVLRRALLRGEVRPAALTHRIATVGPELLRQHFLIRGGPIGDDVLAEIVDEVVIPLVRPQPGQV